MVTTSSLVNSFYIWQIPYFPAYNARVIYTKGIWNCKKWTCAVYVRKISDR